MLGKRQELQEALCRYTTDTLTYINTATGFCEEISSWKDAREKELSKLREIKDKADKVKLSFSHVTKSESKLKGLWEYVKNTVTSKYDDSRRAELQKELADVLEVTLGGLKKLDHFLEAVEKLEVTSLHVFMEENQVLHLPEGISLEHVQVVIGAARQICPLLLVFKRDASDFFLPKLQNVAVLSYQLDKYIKTTQTICEMFEKGQRLQMTKKHLADLSGNLSEDDKQRIVRQINQHFELRLRFQRTATETVVDLDVDLTEDEIEKMLDHINQLHKIRMDQNFRLLFLFQDVSCSGFISEFKKRQPRMLKFLSDLEEVAVQLDRMNKGSKISSVAGSSVGGIGGVLSIVGLVFIPVTAGVSAVLTLGGAALGVISGVNTIFTTTTEMGVNHTQQKKASEVFQSFMEDVQSLQGCLEEVISEQITKMEAYEMEVLAKARKMFKEFKVITKGIDVIVDALYAGKLTNATGSNVPRAAVKEIPALSKAAKAGFIAANALCLGMDLIFICKDGYSLYKGSETQVSKFIRARAALWSSEMDSWKKIHDSLCKGQKTSDEHRAVLDKMFYPKKAIKKNKPLCKVLPRSNNEHAVLDNPSDPVRVIKRKESFQTRMANYLWMENKMVLCIVIAIAVMATLINSR